MAFAIVTDCNEGQILVLEAVGCKRELYGDASRYSNGETPNLGLDTPTSPTRQPPAEQHVPGQTSVAQRESC